MSKGTQYLLDLVGRLRHKSKEKERDEPVSQPEQKPEPPPTPDEPAPQHLAPVRHPQRDFFMCDVLDAAPKDDLASMEHPMFALKAGDRTVRRYEHRNASVEVIPSVKGLATIHDKDVLIYVISQMIEALNRGRKDLNRTVRVTAYDLLVTTNRRTDGDSYNRLQAALDRLAGTRVSTNIKTGNKRERSGFGLIDGYRIVELDGRERMASLEVTISPWLWRAVQAREVLTISRDYFRLRKPLDRRIYELCRKHCGSQQRWCVGLATLQSKSGSTTTLRKFRAAIKSLADSNQLPDYRLRYDEKTDKVIAYPRSPKGGAAQLKDIVSEGG